MSFRAFISLFCLLLIIYLCLCVYLSFLLVLFSSFLTCVLTYLLTLFVCLFICLFLCALCVFVCLLVCLLVYVCLLICVLRACVCACVCVSACRFALVALGFLSYFLRARYRLRVVVGDGVMRRCGIGGYHGGIRSCTAAEEKHWMRFFPKDLRGSRKGHWAKGSVPFCLQGTLFLRSPCAKGHVAVSFGGSLLSPSGACNLLSGRKPRAMRGQIFQDPAQAANVPSPLQLVPLHCLPLPGCSFQVLSHLG